MGLSFDDDLLMELGDHLQNDVEHRATLARQMVVAA
jgi:hypothetical protein